MFALLMAPLFMGGDDPDPGMSSGSSTGLSSNCKLITVRVRPSLATRIPLPPVTCPNMCTNSDVLSIGRRRVRRSREMLVIKEVGSVPVLVVNLPHRARLGEPGRGVGFHRGRRPVVGWSRLGLRLIFGAYRIKWRTVIPGDIHQITVHEELGAAAGCSMQARCESCSAICVFHCNTWGRFNGLVCNSTKKAKKICSRSHDFYSSPCPLIRWTLRWQLGSGSMCPSGRAGFHGQSTEIWATQTNRRKDKHRRNRAGKHWRIRRGALSHTAARAPSCTLKSRRRPC